MNGVLRYGTAPESGERISIYKKCRSGCGFPLTNRNIMIKYNFKHGVEKSGRSRRPHKAKATKTRINGSNPASVTSQQKNNWRIA
jgi:hypothetical protein